MISDVSVGRPRPPPPGVLQVAEPSGESPHYPHTRTKDWYDGHAWASGIFEFGDGKNQVIMRCSVRRNILHSAMI